MYYFENHPRCRYIVIYMKPEILNLKCCISLSRVCSSLWCRLINYRAAIDLLCWNCKVFTQAGPIQTGRIFDILESDLTTWVRHCRHCSLCHRIHSGSTGQWSLCQCWVRLHWDAVMTQTVWAAVTSWTAWHHHPQCWTHHCSPASSLPAEEEPPLGRAVQCPISEGREEVWKLIKIDFFLNLNTLLRAIEDM